MRENIYQILIKYVSFILGEKAECVVERTNDTDDKKVEKILQTKTKTTKKIVQKGLKNVQFSVKVIEGHHHPVCAVDSNKDIIVSGG